MKRKKCLTAIVIALCCLGLLALPQAMAAKAKFDLSKFSDMSDFDPNNPLFPAAIPSKLRW